MKLFKLTRTDDVGYDEYDSSVIAADTKEKALFISLNYHWTVDNKVEIEYIGTAKRGTKEGVILDSFNAG